MIAFRGMGFSGVRGVMGEGAVARLSHKNVLIPTYILPRFFGGLPAYLN